MRAAAILLVVIGLGATPAGAVPSATLAGGTPTTNLRQGSVVVMDVTGFDGPGLGLLTLVQCPRGATAITACARPQSEDLMALDAPTSGAAFPGTGTGPFTVQLIPGLCDATHRCSIYALEGPDSFGTAAPHRFAAVDFTFAGDAEAPPAPSTDSPSAITEARVGWFLALGLAALFGAFVLKRRGGVSRSGRSGRRT